MFDAISETGPEGIAWLASRMSSVYPKSTRRAAVIALSRSPDPATIPVLVDALDNADPDVVRFASWGLDDFDENEVAPHIASLLQSGRGGSEAAHLFSRFPYAAVVPVLVRGMSRERREECQNYSDALTFQTGAYLGADADR